MVSRSHPRHSFITWIGKNLQPMTEYINSLKVLLLVCLVTKKWNLTIIYSLVVTTHDLFGMKCIK